MTDREQDPDRLAVGRLLVATPELLDPNFRRTVVYLIAHGPDGSVGVVLNRPSETALHNVLPVWSEHVTAPRAVYVGGPVQTNGAMCVAVRRSGSPIDMLSGMASVSGPVVLVDLDGDPDELTPVLRGLRVYAGHAGWSEGQLADEVTQGSWFVLDSRPDDLLAGAGVDLWFRVLKRQRLPLAFTAYHPGDLTVN